MRKLCLSTKFSLQKLGEITVFYAEQIRRKPGIFSYLLKKSLTVDFIFVQWSRILPYLSICGNKSLAGIGLAISSLCSVQGLTQFQEFFEYIFSLAYIFKAINLLLYSKVGPSKLSIVLSKICGSKLFADVIQNRYS